MFVVRRQRRPDGDSPRARRPLRAERHHLVGHRVRRAQPARRLHADLGVPGLDQPDTAVLTGLDAVLSVTTRFAVTSVKCVTYTQNCDSKSAEI